MLIETDQSYINCPGPVNGDFHGGIESETEVSFIE